MDTAKHDISLASSELERAALPDVCARHGLAVASRQELALTVRKKDPEDPLLLNTNVIGMANRAGEQLKQQAARRADWPLCRQCATRRSVNMAAAKGLAILAPLLIAGGIIWRIAAGQNATAGVLLGIGILALPLALWAGWRSRVAAIAKAKLSQDRTQISIHEPSPAFAHQWHELNPGQ